MFANQGFRTNAKLFRFLLEFTEFRVLTDQIIQFVEFVCQRFEGFVSHIRIRLVNTQYREPVRLNRTLSLPIDESRLRIPK